MGTLLSYFTDFFTFGLALDEQLTQGGAYANSADQVYVELREKLKAAKLSAEQAQKRSSDIDEATFAVAAWLDEIMARHDTWWSGATPLQVTLFDTNNAGNEFYIHLSHLTAEQDEAREVYYVALCLGFVGQYYFETSEAGELGKLKENHGRQLPADPVPMPSLIAEKITAQPYRMVDPVGRALPSVWPERLAKLGTGLAVAAIAGYLGYQYLMGLGIKQPVKIVDAVEVREHLAAYACHDFDVQTSSAGSITVTGHVQSTEDRTRLIGELHALPGGAQIDVQVDTLSQPFCEVVGIALPLQRSNITNQQAFKVSLRGDKNHLLEGDTIIADAKLPKFAACLYIDYFVADGKTVVHLFPNAINKKNCRAAGEALSIGEPVPGRPPWQVSEPFGREMIVAFASSTPLFSQPREELEAPKDYLIALRKAIDAKNGDVVADYDLISTQKKQP